MHLRVTEIAGGFYHTVVLLRQRNQEIMSDGTTLLNSKDFRAYNNQYNMSTYLDDNLSSSVVSAKKEESRMKQLHLQQQMQFEDEAQSRHI